VPENPLCLTVSPNAKTMESLLEKYSSTARFVPFLSTLPFHATKAATGYCEQQDVHLPTATVREALEFSALLRQPRSTPKEKKLAYVDTIIDLLELHDIEDAIIGVPGAGLGIEQRKRLTIGVELSAKPLLLFLDEVRSFFLAPAYCA
jgi:ABC-type multidrug transport system ATPase subunit